MAAGLNLLKEAKFTIYTTRDGLTSNTVLALFGDATGNLWAGTPEGLSRFRDGRFTNYTAADGLANGLCQGAQRRSIRQSLDGHARGPDAIQGWSFQDLYRSGRTSQRFRQCHSHRAPAEVCGLARWRLEQIHERGVHAHLTTRDGLSSDIITSLYEDSDVTLWIGTNGGGLNRLKDGHVHRFYHARRSAG